MADSLRTVLDMFLGRRRDESEDQNYWRFVSRRSDADYLKLMVRSLKEPSISGVRMPGFPGPDVQRQFVGSADEHALQEAYNFYQILKGYCRRFGVPLRPDTRVLDFGCGWGRIARFFFKDVRGNNIYGVDVDPEMIAFCQASMPCGSYSVVNAVPPMTFAADSLDVIFAFSVFSHLAEPVALEWIREFARVLRPGGILLATTQSRAFLDFCAALHAKGPPFETHWHKALAESFLPIDASRRAYDSGQMLFSPTGGGAHRDRSFYGEALIPRQYVERTYAPYLAFRDWFEDLEALAQALFVLQKPLHGASQNDR